MFWWTHSVSSDFFQTMWSENIFHKTPLAFIKLEQFLSLHWTLPPEISDCFIHSYKLPHKRTLLFDRDGIGILESQCIGFHSYFSEFLRSPIYYHLWSLLFFLDLFWSPVLADFANLTCRTHSLAVLSDIFIMETTLQIFHSSSLLYYQILSYALLTRSWIIRWSHSNLSDV